MLFDVLLRVLDLFNLTLCEFWMLFNDVTAEIIHLFYLKVIVFMFFFFTNFSSKKKGVRSTLLDKINFDFASK